MKFKVYGRKSIYTGKGESVENQIEMCTSYIFANYPGTTDADITVYEDEGFSGKNLDRPKFQQMMRDTKAQRPDCIVCYRLDRISRNVGDFASLIEQLNNWSISFICIKEKFDTSTPMGKAMMYIASVFAQLERETIAERVRDNMMMLARTGRWLGGPPPTGLKAEKRQEVILDGKVKSSCILKSDPKETHILDAIFDTFYECRTLHGVKLFLHAKGIKSRNGKDFSLIAIKDIIRNPIHCAADTDAWDYFHEKGADLCFDRDECSDTLALITYNKRDYTKGHVPRNPIEKWIVAKGKHPGRLTGKRWIELQAILDNNRPDREFSNQHNDYSLLSGMIYCSKCGKRMFAKNRTGNGRNTSGLFDYLCQNKMTLGTAMCDSQNLAGDNADDTVCQYLLSYAQSTSGLYSLLEQLKRKIKTEDKPSPLNGINKRIEDCNKEVENLVSVLAQSVTNKLLYQKVNGRVQELEREIERLQAAKMEAEAQAIQGSSAEIQLEMFSAALAAFKENFNTMTIGEKRTLIRLMVQKCEWDGENLHIFIYGE